MRTNPRHDSNLKINPLQEAIIEACEKAVDWTHIQALIETLGQKGLVDPAAKWDPQGRAMLGALMNARPRGYDATVPENILELALRLDPQALTRKDSGGNTPVDMFLDSMQEGSSTARWNSAKWWLAHSPKPLLFGWAPNSKYGDEPPHPEPNGYHLLTTVLEAEREFKQMDHTLISDLAAIGVDMNAKNRKGYSPAGRIDHAPQWNAYLEHGGDPEVVVNEGHDKGGLPLWRYLVDRSYDTASIAAQAWASEHLVDTMKQKLYGDYWELLQEKMKYSSSPAQIPGIVRSHADYLNLRDPEGRSAVMYVIQMHGSAYKNLQQKQYAPLNKLRDGKGYSLWHYALSKGKYFSASTMKFLLDAGAPIDPNPLTGRGLIPSLLIDFPHMVDKYDRFPRSIEDMRKHLKKTTGEQWWAMQEGDWERMRKPIDEVLAMKNASPVFCYLACEFLDHIPDKTMRAVFLEYNLSQYGDNISVNGVKKFFELGDADNWDQKKVDALKHKIGEEAFSEIQSIRTHKNLQSSVDMVPSARKSPRL